MKSPTLWLLTTLATLLLLACGGGSGSATPNSSGTAPPPVVTSVPGAPTIGVALAGDASASIAFAPPASDGGAPISGYTVICAGAGTTKSTGATNSPITLATLTNGVTYTCNVIATNAKGDGAASASVSVTPVAPVLPGSLFTLGSASAVGGTLPADYTCDGTGSTPALTWTNAPSGTTEFAVLMSTLPGDGSTKYNWVLYGIPAKQTGLVRNSVGVGTLGVGSDGPVVAYQPPCSQGLGEKIYTFKVYALSAAPAVSGTAPVSGATLSAALSSITLGSASLNLSYTRTATSTGLSTHCDYISSSVKASTTGNASVACDGTYAYVASDGLPTHAMMNGITATNLQVPTAQNFRGNNAWKIPLNPAIATSTTTAVDGPIGVAINGVPIFNPCKQGGCGNGDTKVLGELDVCNGHAGRADDYHYHAAPVCMMAGKSSSYWDTHPVGWALDGFAIFGYNNADGSTANRDSICGGNTSAVTNAPAGYSYHVTDASPYVLSCFRGTPSPDLAGQAAKFKPLRQPPVTPFAVSAMTLSTDTNDGYQVLQFTSARSFVTTETGSDSYTNSAGSYRIRYKPVTGAALSALLTQPANAGKTACWNFQFTTAAAVPSQPTVSYCN